MQTFKCTSVHTGTVSFVTPEMARTLRRDPNYEIEVVEPKAAKKTTSSRKQKKSESSDD